MESADSGLFSMGHGLVQGAEMWYRVFTLEENFCAREAALKTEGGGEVFFLGFPRPSRRLVRKTQGTPGVSMGPVRQWTSLKHMGVGCTRTPHTPLPPPAAETVGDAHFRIDFRRSRPRAVKAHEAALLILPRQKKISRAALTAVPSRFKSTRTGEEERRRTFTSSEQVDGG